jgi:hypothetical protein
MNAPRGTRPAGVAIAVVIALTCGDLLSAWRHAPYDRLGGWAFGLWLATGGVILILERRRPEGVGGYFLAGLGLALAGFVAELNVLQHAALAVTLAGFMPGGAVRGWWLAAAVSWLPALGWGLAPLVGPTGMNVIRLGLVIGGSALAVQSRRPA